MYSLETRCVGVWVATVKIGQSQVQVTDYTLSRKLEAITVECNSAQAQIRLADKESTHPWLCDLSQLGFSTITVYTYHSSNLPSPTHIRIDKKSIIIITEVRIQQEMEKYGTFLQAFKEIRYHGDKSNYDFNIILSVGFFWA